MEIKKCIKETFTVIGKEGSTNISMIEADNPQKVAEIVQATIKEIYPHYYPVGVVKFFMDLHSVEKIRMAMDAEKIYLFVSEDIILGTGSIRGNEICRLFVLPNYQGKGYGSRFIDLLEKRIFSRFPTVSVDASFPAETMYLKKGYRLVDYEKIKTVNGDFLCYHRMEKQCIQKNEGEQSEIVCCLSKR